jgi:large subunit ribosomal protein L30
MKKMYAAIRVRGKVNLSYRLKKTLDMLNLKSANHLSLWQESKGTKKMLERAQGHITFGEIDDETLKLLIEKRAEAIAKKANASQKNEKKTLEDKKTSEKKVGEKKIDAKKVAETLKSGKRPAEAGIRNCFRLAPPRKGYDRKGVKKPFALGGALGYRGKEINTLIRRMI